MYRHHLAHSSRTRALAAVLAAVGLMATLAPTASAQSAATAGCLTWTPDRSGLVYCATSGDGASELFERSADGRVRQLTYLGGAIGSADVSPDGRMVTFHASLPGFEGPQVYVIPRHGPRVRKILVGSAVVEIGRRWVMIGGTPIEIEGASARRLTDQGSNWDPVFTPDGDEIGFASDRLGPISLWSMDIDGADQRELLVATID